MKNFLILIFLSVLTWASYAIPFRPSTDTIELGTGATGDIFYKADIGLGASNPYIKLDSASGKWQFFNQGATSAKNLGSGSGTGGSGGINILLNSGFEDGVASWTNSGGTPSSQLYVNPIEGNEKYLRFISSATSQYVQQVFAQFPENITGGCMADFRYKDGGGFDYKVIVDPSGTPETVSIGSLEASTGWVKAPTITYDCPSSGSAVALRIESTTASTVQIDDAYLGSNKGFIASESRSVYGARISGAGNIVSQSGNWLSGTTCPIVGSSRRCTYSVSLSNPMSCSVSMENASTTDASTTEIELGASTTTYIEYNSSVSGTGNNVFDVSIVCRKQEPDLEVQEAYYPEQADFFIDVSIGGGSVTLVNTAGSPLTASSTTFDMVLNSGSAKIPCTGSNSPTGLTCSSGDEEVGIVFNAPVSGKYKICIALNKDGASASNFRLAETPLNSQTIVQQGSENSLAAIAGAQSIRLCEHFNFSSSGEKAVRLFYESVGAGTIYADRDPATYERDIHLTVEMVSHNVSRPIIQNMVTTGYTGGMKVESCKILNDGTPTVDNSGVCGWIDSLSWVSAGTVDITMNGWISEPYCVCTTVDNATINECQFDIGSVSSMRSKTRTSAGGVGDAFFNIVCTGERN